MPPKTRQNSGNDELMKSKAALEEEKKEARQLNAKLRKAVAVQEALAAKQKEALAAKTDQSSRKKQRTNEGKKWPVIKNAEMTLYFANQTKNVQYRKKKFLANDRELEDLVWDVALTTSAGDDLSALNKHDQDEMARRYSEAYGVECARDINGKRSSWQQAAKNAFFQMLSEGIAVTGAKLLFVAQRPKEILMLDEDVSNELTKEEADENKALNLKNKKWRDLFDNYNDKFLGNCLGKKVWSEEKRSLKTISGRDGTTPPLITSSDEAMAVVLVMNAEAKWLIQWKCKRDDEPEPPRKLLRPHIKWSDDAGGSCQWGGWHKEGRLKFQKVRGQIKKGRSLETTQVAEEQCCERLYYKHDMENKLASRKRKPKVKVPKIDLVGADVGFESEGDFEFESYESDGDTNQLLAEAMVKPAAAAAEVQQEGEL